MGLGPSWPPPHTSLRCGYGNGNNSWAGQEETHHPGLQEGGLLLPHSQSLGGLESSRERGHPQGQVCRRKPSPAQGGPPAPEPPRCSDGCAHTDVPAGPGHTCAYWVPAVHCPLGFITQGELTSAWHAYSGGARTVCGLTPGSAVTDAHLPRQSCPVPPPTRPSLSPGGLDPSSPLCFCLSVRVPVPLRLSLISTSLLIMKPGVEGTWANPPVPGLAW